MKFFQSHRLEIVIIFCLSLLCIFGYFYNLGLVPLHADEAIRGTVAHEMMVSKNYIVPTISGEFYYRKPPLYNWLLIGVFNLTGSFSEFVIRLPSVIPLFLFCATIWFSVKRYFGNRVGILAAFLFLLMGSLLSRDSMLGHIDIFYSWITFIGFMIIFHYYEKKQFWHLFLISYSLAAAGVLMKGLPSFLFQGFTILAWFVYKREFKKLFHLAHFAGIILFVMLIGSYFYAYSQYNSLTPFFEALYSQSSQRTVLEKEWYEGILNIFTFPLENLFTHMMPTALIFLFALKKGIFRAWFKNDFLAFIMITFLVNVIPYWLSPGFYPRYLYMLYPLLFILGAFAYYQNRNELKVISKIFETLFLVTGSVLSVVFLAPIFQDDFAFIDHRILKSAILFAFALAAVIFFIKIKTYRIYFALIFIALFRIGFDAYILPYRVVIEPNQTTLQKMHAEKILELTEGKDLYLFKNSPIKYEYNYYLGTARNEILKRVNSRDPEAFYIAHENFLENIDHKVVYTFTQDYDFKPELLLIKFE